LKLTGASGLVGELQGLVEKGTNWTLTRNAAGEVWRTAGRSVDGIPVWQVTAREYYERVFGSEIQISLNAVNTKEARPAVFNDLVTDIDPKEFSFAYLKDGRWGSAILVHEFNELYERKVNGLSWADAHEQGCRAEAAVYVGGGTRTTVLTELGGGRYIWRFVYTLTGQTVVLTWDRNLAINLIAVDF
jgi:hypothetical protein